MRAWRASTLAWFVGAPFAVASGCVLPSFERVPEHETGVTGGTSGSSGSGGMPTGGIGPGGQGATGGEGGAPGGEGGGAGDGGTPGTIAVFKHYVVEQGTNLAVSTSEGLFVYSGTDDRDWTSVTRSGRDTSLPADVATLDIEPRTGAFTFEPAPELFGVYHATYELRNAAEERALGDLYITVQPVSVDIGVVADGIGGFAVSGQSDEGIGRAVAGAGDVDHDGFDDFLVGAPTAAGGAGRVYVVFGGTEHESFELDPSPSSGARYSVLEGTGTEALGTSVSAAGDLDGDDFGDFVVGAPGELGAANGRAYVVHGRARGELTGSIRDLVSTGGITLTRADNENVGALVAGGGDLTGDDTPDFVVFAAGSLTFYVVDGAADADVDLETGSARAFRGNSVGAVDTASFRALALLGDVNDDGPGELMVGTGAVVALMNGPASTFPLTLTASAFTPDSGLLVQNMPPLGFVAVSAAADFDGDGARDSAFCHERNAASARCRIFRGMPTQATDGVALTGFGGGRVRVAGGGETSGDGFSDLLFSETDATVVPATSSAWVLFGRAQPVSSLSVQTLGARGFSIEGGGDIESIALAGDIDGPARDASKTADWLVGDVAAAGGNGRVTVIFGGTFSR